MSGTDSVASSPPDSPKTTSDAFYLTRATFSEDSDPIATSQAFIHDYDSFLDSLHESIETHKTAPRMDPTLIALHCNLTSDPPVPAETLFSNDTAFLNVMKITLSSQSIRHIRCLDLFTNLTHLYLSNNEIRSLPQDQFEFLDNLRVLALNHNHIDTLENLSHLEALYFLDVSENEIGVDPGIRLAEQIPQMFPRYLRICNIAGNPCNTKAVREEMLRHMPYLMNLNDEPVTVQQRQNLGLEIAEGYEDEFQEMHELLGDEASTEGEAGEESSTTPILPTTSEYINQVDALLSDIKSTSQHRETFKRRIEEISTTRNLITQEHEHELSQVTSQAQSSILSSLQAKIRASQQRMEKMRTKNVKDKVSKPISLSRISSLSSLGIRKRELPPLLSVVEGGKATERKTVPHSR